MSHPEVEKFTIACPQCGELVAVSQAHVGKKGRCGICHTVFPIVAPAGMLQRAAPLAAANVAKSLWDDPQALPTTAPIESATPMTSMADDYMKRARNDRGGAIEQEESDPSYRFATSYGGVIGGITTIILGTLLALICLFVFGSMKLTAACIVMIIGGIGWLVQGLNYITYYRWKDRGGRDPKN